MAITGTFTADFSSFQAAVEQANVTLNGFQSNSRVVETQLTKMSNALAGNKMIADATVMAEAVAKIGGVSRLTGDELTKLGAQAAAASEKMRALGLQVPENLQQIADAAKKADGATTTWSSSLSTLQGYLGALGIQATISGLISFAQGLFNDADALTRLSDQTAVGTETLQRFRVAGDDAGVTLEAMANGMNKLQRNLGEGKNSTVGALGDLHLQLSALRTLSPEQQFYAVADAIKKIKDPAEQVAAAVQLFGKSGAELLPVIKRGFEDVKDASAGMSKETVTALDDAGDAVGRFWRATKGVFGEALADVLTGTTSAWRQLKSEIQELPAIVGNDAVAHLWDDILPPSLPADLDEIIAKSDAWAKETKAIQEAMVELNAVGQGWYGTLQTIDGATVEAIKYYLDAGVAQDKLATAYGLTAAQVKAVASAMKDEQDAAKQEAKIVEQTTKLWDEYFDQRVQHGGTATDQQMAQIDRWYEDTVAKLTAMGAYNEQTATAAYAVWHEKLAGVLVDWDDVNKHSKQSLQEIADKAKATADYVLVNASSFTADYVRLKQQEAVEAERAAYHWRDTFAAAAESVTVTAKKTSQDVIAEWDKVEAAARKAREAITSSVTYDLSTPEGMAQFQRANPGAVVNASPEYFKTHTLQDAVQAGLVDLYAGLKSMFGVLGVVPLAGRAAGGPVTSGTPYWVGERGPELFVPPSSGLIEPSGAGAVYNLTFNVVDTESEIARRVSDQILRTMRMSTQMGSA